MGDLTRDKTSLPVEIIDESNGRTADVGLKADGLTEALHVIAEVVNNGGGGGDGACPTVTPKMRNVWSNDEVSLNNSGQSFTEIFSYDGSGKFFGCNIEFDSDNIQVRIEVDGEALYEDYDTGDDFVNCAFLDDITITGGEDNTENGLCIFDWNRSKNRLDVCFPCPIAYSTNVTIEARANSGSNSRDMERFQVILTKET